MPLTRDQIIDRDDEQIEEVPVPEWGGTVLVRGMSGLQREQFEASIRFEKPAANRAARRRGETETDVDTKMLRERMVVWCAVDSAGVRLFSDDDMVLLRSKNAAALERVTGVAMRLSGIREDDIDALAEEMLENPTVASPSL